MTVFWIRLCLGNCSVICTVTLRYVLDPAHSEFWYIQLSAFFRCMPTYSIIFSVTKAYSRILRPCWSYLRVIEAYSVRFVTLVYSQPYHILAWHSPGIFRTEGLLKTLWNVDQAYSESCHRHYSGIVRHIQNLVQQLHI